MVRLFWSNRFTSMGDNTREIPIPNDEGGFAAFECHWCGERFKLSAAELIERDPQDLCCPDCGLSNSRGHFLTQDVLAVANVVAQNLASELLDKAPQGLQRRTSNSSGIFQLQIKGAGVSTPEPEPIIFEPPDLEIVRFSCCDIHVKVRSEDNQQALYCPYCGELRTQSNEP